MKLTKRQIILIVFVIGILFISSNVATEQEKKEGFSFTRLLIGLILISIGIFAPIGFAQIPVFLGGILFLRYTYIKTIEISPIMWIIGFFILAIMALKRK